MRIGFIGLGQMGKPMALNMLKSEAELMVYVRKSSVASDFQSHGAKITTTLSDIAKADIIFLCLPDTKVVQDVLLSQNGLLNHLKKGQIIVDFSTIDYNAAVEIAGVLAKRDILFMDAPVSGMELRAIDGTLTIMCGGDVELFNKIYPYLKYVGNNILYMGGSGSGQLTKLINQILYDINIAALAEILPTSVKMGLDPNKVGQVINSGTGKSHASEYFIPRILRGEFISSYPMKGAYKDLVSAVELGVRLCIPMPLTNMATSIYQKAILQGYGDCDKSSMIRVYEESLGVAYRSRKV